MPDVVLLHGALGSGAQMADLARALSAGSCPDLDGHGHRPAAAHDLDAFVQTALIGQGEVDLVGYSLGGYVALAAAITHPERVRRVVTIATKLAWSPELAAKEARRLDADRLAERNPAFLAALEAQHPGPGARAVLDETARFLLSLGDGPGLALSQVRCPVLVVVGTEDALVGDEDVQRAQTLPDGTLYLLPGAPHQLEQMSTDTLAEIVRDFLA